MCAAGRGPCNECSRSGLMVAMRVGSLYSIGSVRSWQCQGYSEGKGGAAKACVSVSQHYSKCHQRIKGEGGAGEGEGKAREGEREGAREGEREGEREREGEGGRQREREGEGIARRQEAKHRPRPKLSESKPRSKAQGKPQPQPQPQQESQQESQPRQSTRPRASQVCSSGRIRLIASTTSLAYSARRARKKSAFVVRHDLGFAARAGSDVPVAVDATGAKIAGLRKRVNGVFLRGRRPSFSVPKLGLSVCRRRSKSRSRSRDRSRRGRRSRST